MKGTGKGKNTRKDTHLGGFQVGGRNEWQRGRKRHNTVKEKSQFGEWTTNGVGKVGSSRNSSQGQDRKGGEGKVEVLPVGERGE